MHTTFKLASEMCTDTLESFANSSGRVIGTHSNPNGPRRSEITTPTGTTLVLHYNTGGGRGIYAAAARPNLLAVRLPDDRICTLVIEEDPNTAESNPIYLFKDGVYVVGRGYGQRMDLVLASAFLSNFHGIGGNFIEPAVLNWIRHRMFI